MIKYLVFDFGKVLVDYDFMHIIDEFFTDKADEEEFCKLFTTPEFIDSCDKEDIPFIEIIRNMQAKHPKFAMQAQIFYDRYVDFVTGEVAGMRDVLNEMRSRGYKLYGLTNWCSKVHEVMKKFDILTLLDDRIISSEEHLLKPDVAIYKRLCEKFNIKPEECVFTDDKAVNVVGAISAGMHGIVFQNAKQYKRELEVLLTEEK